MTSVQEKQSFFYFPHPLNSSVARTVAAGVVIMAVATIVFDQPWITLLLSYGFIARVLTGPRFSPLAQMAIKVVIPVLSTGCRPPKAFRGRDGSSVHCKCRNTVGWFWP